MPGVAPYAPCVQRRNEDYPWDEFDTEAYLAHNYEHVRHDDDVILRAVGSFFAAACRGKQHLNGIDVGTGANLYPALAMLPFCEEITLLEYSRSNVDWLESQKENQWPSWDSSWEAFWQLLCRWPAYKRVKEPGIELAKRAKVHHGNLFDLPRDHSYDLGTMFFVAESISPEHAEFDSAMEHFLNSLTRQAPFAIALMEHSGGYRVGDNIFPATDIGIADVTKFLQGKATDVEVRHIGPGTDPVREGYTGMIIAYGYARGVG